jgi:hypothetical protein
MVTPLSSTRTPLIAQKSRSQRVLFKSPCLRVAFLAVMRNVIEMQGLPAANRAFKQGLLSQNALDWN